MKKSEIYFQMKRKSDHFDLHLHQPQAGGSSFKCIYCDETFSEDVKRQNHINIAHRDRIVNKVRFVYNFFVY